MLFSQRNGITPVGKSIQSEGIDDDLRHGLWSAYHICIIECHSSHDSSSNIEMLFKRYWLSYFKFPIDNLPYQIHETTTRLRKYFFSCEWFCIYDFIEFTAKNAPDKLSNNFCDFCNHVLERECSAYRFVEKQIVEMTTKEEIESIEEAIESTNKFAGTQAHFKSALILMSDRKSPNYRNSIKESISAIESLAKHLTGKETATLGAALKIIESKHNLHPALKSSLASLYGYTSDADGIRHAMLEESDLTFTDAKFMLVVCSAFVNYLIGKTA